jgi:hypothetical protein
MSAQPETIDGLAGKIEDCQKRLDAAELARQPTTRIEGELASLTREHDAAVQAKAAEIQAARDAEDDQIEREAQAEADALAARIGSVLPPITIPTPDVDLASIVAATRVHQRARCEFDKVVATLAEAKKKADIIAGLIAEHEDVVARIGDRLDAGAELPSDDIQRRRSQQLIERKASVLAAAKAEVASTEKAMKQADDARKRAYEALTVADESLRRAGYVMRLETLRAATPPWLSFYWFARTSGNAPQACGPAQGLGRGVEPVIPAKLLHAPRRLAPMSSSSEIADRQAQLHPRRALSKASTQRLLSQLLRRAKEGDAASAESLIRLGRESRRSAPTRAE